jgi:serine/threonine-protein kinase
MAGNRRVTELLLRWDDLRAEGQSISVEELCKDCPEHREEVERGISVLRALYEVADTATPASRPNEAATVAPTRVASAEGPPGLPPIPDYEILGELGRGGMGVVYKARQVQLNRLVALKMVLSGGHAGPAEIARFRREAEAVARLQHPHIVQIHEVGEADGKPFFSLEYVDGGSLADKLDGTPWAASQAAPLVETLARAVHAAHQKGVIHRDLKPGNVLLTAEGQPKVTDFGLAKQLDSEKAQTQSGAIVGTPSYMAPEQAGGKREELGPAADVYALGAILYELLTGRPPFRGETPLDTVIQVVSGEPVPPSRLQPKVSRELETICLKCLEKSPASRYSSALALAEDLARGRAGEPILARPVGPVVRLGKLARRRPAVAGLLAGLVAVVTTAFALIVWQLQRVEEQRRAANTNAAQARLNAAEAQGNAKRARHEAAAKARALAAEQKARRQAFAALRSMTVEVVERKFAQGAALTTDDRAFLRGVIQQFDAFAQIQGDEADSRAVRAEGRLRVGSIRYTLGELKEAEKDYEQALHIYQQLAADFPSRPEFRLALASSHNKRGLLLSDTGRFAEAEKDYDQALSIRKKLAADFPNQSEFRRKLASSHNNRGNLLRATGRLQDARKDYDQALSIQKRLAAEVPSRPEFREDLALSQNNRASLLRDMYRLKEAENDFDQAITIQKRLAADFPSRPEFGAALARSHSNRATLLRDAGRLAEAGKDYEQALRIYRELAADFPSHLEFRQGLARSHYSRGILLYATGWLQEGKKNWNEALAIYKRLAADFPSRPDFRQELARCHNARANLLSDRGRPKEAENDYDQAVRIYIQLAAEVPSRPEFRLELASSHNNRGNLLRATGRLQDAREDYDRALGIYKRLAAEFASRREFRQQMALSHNNRGDLLRATGRLQDARKDYDQALSIQKRLAAEVPNRPDVQNDLAGTCVNLAILNLQQGSWAAAKRLLLEGRPHHLAALKANPQHRTYRQFYHNHLAVLTTAHAVLLEQEDAVRTAESCRDLGWNAPADAYDAACFLSRCIPIVAQLVKLDDKQRKEAVQLYGDAAMKLLRQAVSKGYKDAVHMKKDTGLEPLRQREDFQKLIAELEGKGK